MERGSLVTFVLPFVLLMSECFLLEPKAFATTEQSRTFDAKPFDSGDRRFQSYLLPGESWGLAYEPTSGQIAVTNDQAGVLIFDVDDLLAGKYSPKVISINGIPSGVCLKNFQSRPKFIVSKIDSPLLDVIDSQDLASVMSIKLSGPKGVATITCNSIANDPMLYCIAATSVIKTSEWDDWTGRLLQVDLTNNQILASRERFTSVFPTEDGNTLLGTKLSSPEPSFFRLEKAANSVWGNAEFLDGGYRKSSLDQDLGLKLNCGAFQNQPLVADLRRSNHGTGHAIRIGSTTRSFESKYFEIKCFSKPNEKSEKAGRQWSKSISNEELGTCESWATDDKRDLFLLVKNGVLLICRLNDLDLGTPPLFLVPTQRMPRIARIGEKIRFKFDELPDGAKLEFLPDSSSIHVNAGTFAMSDKVYINSDGSGLNRGVPVIVNRELRWMPVPQQAGWNTLKFKASLGEQFAEWQWDVFVSTPSFTLPFSVKGMELSNEIEAVAWGESFPEPDVKEPVFVVAKIDIETRKVVRKMEISEQVRCAACNENDMYFYSSTSKRLFHFDLESRKQVKSVESLPWDRLTIIGGKYLMAEVLKEPVEAREVSCYELPSLEEVSFRKGLDPSLTCRKCESDILWDGILWDENWKPKLLLHPFSSSGRKHPEFPLRDISDGVRLTNGGPMLYQISNSGIGRERPVPQQYLQYYPAVLFFSQGSIETRDFSRSRESGSIMNWSIADPRSSSENCYFTSSRNHVYATTSGRVFEIPMDHLIPDRSSRFAIDQAQSHFLLSATEEMCLDYDAENATDFQLSLFAPIAGFKIWSGESSSGHFSPLFDANQLRTLAIEIAGGTPENPEWESLKSYVRTVNPMIQKLTNTQPKGIAIPIRAVITANNFEETSGFQHYFYIDVPETWIVPPGVEAQ